MYDLNELNRLIEEGAELKADPSREGSQKWGEDCLKFAQNHRVSMDTFWWIAENCDSNKDGVIELMKKWRSDV